MIIDFHTHIFPDKVAAKAIPNLSSIIHLPPSMNGTVDGLRASMEQGELTSALSSPLLQTRISLTPFSVSPSM